MVGNQSSVPMQAEKQTPSSLCTDWPGPKPNLDCRAYDAALDSRTIRTGPKTNYTQWKCAAAAQDWTAVGRRLLAAFVRLPVIPVGRVPSRGDVHRSLPEFVRIPVIGSSYPTLYELGSCACRCGRSRAMIAHSQCRVNAHRRSRPAFPVVRRVRRKCLFC